MFNSLPRCVPCDKEFAGIKERNIHWSRHCPHRKDPTSRPKLKKRVKLDRGDRLGGKSQVDEGFGGVEQAVPGPSEEVYPEEDIISVSEVDLVSTYFYLCTTGLLSHMIRDSLFKTSVDSGLRLSTRTRKLPGKYQNLVVSTRSALLKTTRASTPVVTTSNPLSLAEQPRSPSPTPSVSDVASTRQNTEPFIFYYHTEPDEFGVFKCYKSSLPSVDPDENLGLDNVADAPTFSSNNQVNLPARSYSSCFGIHIDVAPTSFTNQPISPFPNMNIFRLMDWFYSFFKPSLKMLDSLVRNVILHEDFRQSDFEGFRASAETKRLDNHLAQSAVEDALKGPVPGVLQDGWFQTSITIPAPRARHTYRSENDMPKLTIDGLWYRKPLEVIKEALNHPSSADFHLQGHKLLWNRADTQRVHRLHSEVYNSDRLLEIERGIRNDPSLPGPNVETVVLPIKLYSDSTVLSMIGNVSLWPIYMFFGSMSKYASMKPSSNSECHIAYIPSVYFTSIFSCLFVDILCFSSLAQSNHHTKNFTVYYLLLK
jgi:hypothetical protein